MYIICEIGYIYMESRRE